MFHLAAQPFIRLAYDKPYQTIHANILGTLNILELVRTLDFTNKAVIITTDKCYKNKEHIWGYREEDELGGHDPYSTSKACAELLVDSYRKSFFDNTEKLVASVRAGNVIGGGDFGKDRIVPDCIRSLKNNTPIIVRNPNATRPWQHVLEPLSG